MHTSMNGRKIGLAVLAAATLVAAVVVTRPRDDRGAPQGAELTRRQPRAVAADPAGAVPAAANDVAAPMAPEASSERRDWLRIYERAEDDFSLAQELAAAAVNGDARAQYVLGDLLLRCEVHKRGLAPYKEATVAARVEAHLATLPHGSERSRRSFRREVSRCERLFSEDPFVGRDLPEEAKRFRYWSDRALASGDPLAVIDRATRSVASRASTDKATLRESLLNDVQQVVFSGDAAALFAVGGIFSHPSVVADPTHGYAWQIAACELGYDCSKANPTLGFGCAADGTCLAGETHLDIMQRDLGAAKYAAIYARAQDIKYKIGANDWDGLQQHLEVKD
jgi:hypothetical protein